MKFLWWQFVHDFGSELQTLLVLCLLDTDTNRQGLGGLRHFADSISTLVHDMQELVSAQDEAGLHTTIENSQIATRCSPR